MSNFDPTSMIPPVRIKNPLMADTTYERIEEHVKDAQTNLNLDEELVVTVILPSGQRIVAEDFGFQNPSFIIVYGVDSHFPMEGCVSAKSVFYISHNTLSFVLTTAKKEEFGMPQHKKKRIGFRGGEE